MAVSPSICPNFATGMYMQDFTSQMCANAPTPSGTDYFPIGVLTDRRDNKKYEVRKFADGNCWMVDNLAYGGSDLNNGEDGCLKTIFCGYGYNPDGSCVSSELYAVSTVGKIAPGLYGDCRHPYSSVTIVDEAQYGYLYNWQAAVQDAQAYQNADYQPPQPTQGICPDGWYLPTGGDNGQFQALQVAVGSPTTGFWQAGASWDAVYAGRVDSANAIQQQGNFGLYHSSTQSYYKSNYITTIMSGWQNASDQLYKGNALAVRCLKTP